MVRVNRTEGKGATSPNVCWFCGKVGHFASKCWFRRNDRHAEESDGIDIYKVIRTLENEVSNSEQGNL